MAPPPQQGPFPRRGGAAGGWRVPPPWSATGDDGEAFGDAGHVVQDNTEEEEEHARHQDHCAHTRPRGALPTPSRHNPPLTLAHLHPDALQGHAQTQRLLLGEGQHRYTLLLNPRQEAAPQLARQAQAPLLSNRQRDHVATVAGETYEDGRVVGGVWDGNHGDDIRVVRELGHGPARRESGDAAAPWAADVLLAAAHLRQTDGAAGVLAVQQLGPPPGAVVVEADLALQRRVLRKSLHAVQTGLWLPVSLTGLRNTGEVTVHLQYKRGKRVCDSHT